MTVGEYSVFNGVDLICVRLVRFAFGRDSADGCARDQARLIN